MAARGSFQKRKKEAERREKREVKLARRQGRQPIGGPPSTTEGTGDENPLEAQGVDEAGNPISPSSETSEPRLEPAVADGHSIQEAH